MSVKVLTKTEAQGFVCHSCAGVTSHSGRGLMKGVASSAAIAAEVRVQPDVSPCLSLAAQLVQLITCHVSEIRHCLLTNV